MPFGFCMEVEPPPQAQSTSAISGARRHRRGCCAEAVVSSNARPASSARAKSQGVGRTGVNNSSERAVVETLTLKVEAVVAFSGTLAGTEHVAPVGAPVHVREAVPAMPEPPMERA